MKTLATTLLMLFVSMITMLSVTAFAEDEKSDAAETSEVQPGQAHREKMDTHMKMMKIQMQAIHEETDPEKRKVLMQAHRQSMHEGMKMMHGNGGHGMMGMMHGKKHKGMQGKTGKMDEHARMQHMEHRMNTMHMMMDQMMQHEDAMHHQHSNN